MKANELFEQWLDLRSSVAGPNTIEGYRAIMAGLLRFLGNTPISELDQALLARWIKSRLQVNMDNPNTVRKRITVLGPFLAWCREKGYTTHDPIKGLPRIAPADSCKVPFTWAEYQQTLDACREYEANSENFRVVPDKRDRQGRAITFKRQPRFVQWAHYCIVAWNTGMRISDCALLRWDHVDFISELIIVQPLKMRHQRQTSAVPMEPELLTHLMGLDRSGEWVNAAFHHDYLRHREGILHTFRHILDGIGLTRHSSHSFRHGFVSRLLNAGVDGQVVSQMTGQCQATIARYAHITDDAKRQAMAKARGGQLKIVEASAA